ncbi:hypothetical protein ACFVFQ_27735 [Streptomyces sp. NPDC057743]
MALAELPGRFPDFAGDAAAGAFEPGAAARRSASLPSFPGRR